MGQPLTRLGRTRPAVLSWVPVRGRDGRVRMEMRWHVGATEPASVPRTTAA